MAEHVIKARMTKAIIRAAINGTELDGTGWLSIDRQAEAVRMAIEEALPKGPYQLHVCRIAGRDCTDEQFYAGKHKELDFYTEPCGHAEGKVRGEEVEFFLGVDEFNGHWQNAPEFDFEVVCSSTPIGVFPERCPKCQYFQHEGGANLPTCKCMEVALTATGVPEFLVVA